MEILLFGDSLIARHEGLEEPMLNAKLNPYFPEDQLINKGIGGNTTTDAMKRLKQDVLSIQPDIAVIQFGSNDSAVHKHVPREMYQVNLEQIVEAIGPKHCILVTPPPVDETLQPNRSNQVLESYGEAVKMVADKYGTGFIDLYSAFMKRPDLNELLRGMEDDGLHYGDAGYTLVAETFAPVIEAYKQHVPARKVSFLGRLKQLFT
ncbi:GDSL-type esterase/lipase family protein [Chryseomicrobium palamuruense]|uniref:GDSL-type esterase/lipase family protein n=1 Tax=Chryseomicrobium palamuruense TaxID=682973 RepID=A0ABV8UVX4_9BACL